MASVTRPLASFNSGICTITYTYDDVSLDVTSVDWVNNGGPGSCTVASPAIPAGQRTFTLASGAHSRAIPAGAFTLVPAPKGGLVFPQPVSLTYSVG